MGKFEGPMFKADRRYRYFDLSPTLEELSFKRAFGPGILAALFYGVISGSMSFVNKASVLVYWLLLLTVITIIYTYSVISKKSTHIWKLADQFFWYVNCLYNMLFFWWLNAVIYQYTASCLLTQSVHVYYSRSAEIFRAASKMLPRANEPPIESLI